MTLLKTDIISESLLYLKLKSLCLVYSRFSIHGWMDLEFRLCEIPAPTLLQLQPLKKTSSLDQVIFKQLIIKKQIFT